MERATPGIQCRKNEKLGRAESMNESELREKGGQVLCTKGLWGAGSNAGSGLVHNAFHN